MPMQRSGRGNRRRSGRTRLLAGAAAIIVIAVGVYLAWSLFGGGSSPESGNDQTPIAGETTPDGGQAGDGEQGDDRANGEAEADGDEETQADPEEEATPEELGKVYDIVIAGGRVVNPETHLDKEGMNVGISGDTIEVVTSQPLQGERVIDASGLVVAPGFVDNLSYDPNPLGVWNKIADGVTSNIAMHGGTTVPEQFYRYYERDRPPVHFGASWFYTRARYDQQLGRYDAARPEHTEALLQQAEQALQEGALGISFSFEYVPGITQEEVEPLMDLAYEYNVPVYFHGRYSDMEEPGTNIDTMEEIIGYARKSGAAVHIDHINSTGGTFSMEQSLQMIDEALAEGLDITACVYPYDFWGTYLNSARFDEGWQERFRISYDDLQIAGTEERLTAESFKRYQAEGKLAVAYAIPEEDTVLALQHPNVMIGSDAILEPGHNNHPRASGTFARTIGRYVREQEQITLSEAIRKQSLQPAQRLEKQAPALRKKGRIAKGMDADIVVFDLETISDRSTVVSPELTSAGIEYVLVMGQLALENGELNRDIRLGQGLRSEFVRFEEAAGELLWTDKTYPLVNYRDRLYVDLAALAEHNYGVSHVSTSKVYAIEAGGTASEAGPSPAAEPQSGTLMLERGYTADADGVQAELLSIGERVFMPITDLEALGLNLVNDGDVWTIE
ncbi:amidohydrolase family protein [Paenibacillus sp. IB182496]|uniref:Amidohydrolase family protein n=1 Tax=Paenibacillus sabuli TaxID=2772509 RepID=A0A927BYU0_9BACL|nr:amidohydrolase family protein [Paenibacillus sabuli]MBD2847999.1 amidohydrolase family protein [Paenibacillus sabuli]